MEFLPPVSIIVLNWNGRPFLEACLSSLLNSEYPDFAVIVVDNASNDDSVEFVRQQFPQVKLLFNQNNLGYAAGNNVALRQLDTEFTALVNPDVVVSPNWLRCLIGAMVEDNSIGIAGCKIYYPGGRQLQHTGGYISYPQALPGHYGLGEEDIGQYEAIRDVEYVTGATIALRSAMLNEIGLFDEGFFMYFEEVDLCARARRAGYRVIYVPEASVIHEESAMANRASTFYLQHMNTSRWRFLLKNYDLTSVIQDTIPAEKEYLTILNPSERKAAALAYREIISTLPDIWATRQAHGESQIESVTKEQGRDIDKAMRMLRRIALSGAARGQPDYLVQLTKMWEVQERPFTSTFPLIAPLLSRVREFWNSIATKWYVRQLLHQQNDFNAKVVQELQLLNDQMEMLTTLSQKLDENQLDLMSQVKQLSKRVALLRHSLNELDERMARGETVNNLGADKNLQ